MADPVIPAAAAPNAPAPGTPAAAVTPVVDPAKPTGLDGITKEGLQELYKRTPQMFKEAGIVVEPVKVVDPPKPPEPIKSAAPKYGDVEIKLAADVPFNKEAIDDYLTHAKTIGLSASQAQAEIDFNVAQYRKQANPPGQPKPKTPTEIDAENVAILKQDPEFAKDFDKNMELARRAAVKFGDKDLIGRMTTSDPVLVKHLYRLGKADAETPTAQGGVPRTGSEGEQTTEQAAKTQEDYFNKRYPNSPSMSKRTSA